MLRSVGVAILTGVTGVTVSVTLPEPPAFAAGPAAGPAAVLAATAVRSAVAPAATAGKLQVLQMNLCNTGTDRMCYHDGAAITEALRLIDTVTPDVVTVNEVCQRDVTALSQALGTTANARFEPVWNARTNAVERCANGDPSGDAVLLAPGYPIKESTAGRYTTESNPRQSRVYACVHTAGDRTFYACVTHLSLDNPTALAQCRELLGPVLSRFAAATGSLAPAIVGGDLNLRDKAEGCLPGPSFVRVGDGEVQHVIVESPVTVDRTETIAMQNTDHPALAVRLTLTAAW